MRRNLRQLTLGLAAGALVSGMPFAVNPAEADAVITPASMGTWAFDNRDVNGIVGANPTGVGGMVTGPATPPLGIGSAQLSTGNGTVGGDGAEELRSTGYAGVALSDITALSYSTYDTQNNGQQFSYLGLMLSFDGGLTLGDIVFFEPPYQTTGTNNLPGGVPDQGATAMNLWQTWNALEGAWWDDNGSCNPGAGAGGATTLEACLGTANFDAATIINAGGLGGVRFDVGFAGATDQFTGYVDNFTIGVDGVNTTYDFDPAAGPIGVPEPITLSLFGAGLVGAAAMRRRKRNQS